MSTQQKYQVGKIKQLVDLNGDTTNFEASFRVASTNKEPFYLLVVDQTTLDNTPNLEYKKIENGEISGNVRQDKNVYQNYFLILKADNPCECVVEISKKELPKTPTPPPMPQAPQQPPPVVHKDGFNWKKILLILAVIAFLGVAFYLYSKKNTPPTEVGFKFYSPPKSSRSPVHSEHNSADHGLLDRLKKLNLN